MENEISHLTDEEILRGFKQGNGRVVKEYYYGYCRVAYAIYNRQYGLASKYGMDFYSLAHEYYLYLCKHDFKPLEARKPTMSLKTWMVNGFRYLLLDRLKGTKKERLFESFEQRQETTGMQVDIVDNEYAQEFRKVVREICVSYLGRDSKNSLILQMLLVEGFKGKEVAEQLGMTPSAVTQRYQKVMHDVVIPYFKRYFTFEENTVMSSYEDYCAEAPACSFFETSNNAIMDRKAVEVRTTPEWIDSLKENEVFVFGSNLEGMHGGGAARVACLRFGAVIGQGVGMQGQSYGIPTMQGGVETIRPYVDEFVSYAKSHPEKTFYVTPIGCGIAGFDASDIAPLFRNAVDVSNVCLPASFWEELE